MKEITIITGSTLGSAEYVGEHLADLLSLEGITANVHYGPHLDELPLSGIWLLVISTHGAGQLPDNISPLFAEIEASGSVFTDLSFAAVGLGNSEYDTFCAAIHYANNVLINKGAKRLDPILEIDVKQHLVPEEEAEKWFVDIKKLLN